MLKWYFRMIICLLLVFLNSCWLCPIILSNQIHVWNFIPMSCWLQAFLLLCYVQWFAQDVSTLIYTFKKGRSPLPIPAPNTWPLCGFCFLVEPVRRKVSMNRKTACEMCLCVCVFFSRAVFNFWKRIKELGPVATNTHTIHGNGIFTYMNGWSLWVFM